MKRKMTRLEWNQAQMVEALGNTNRWYFYQKYGREATSDEELIRFYIESGGAINYAHDHPDPEVSDE